MRPIGPSTSPDDDDAVQRSADACDDVPLPLADDDADDDREWTTVYDDVQIAVADRPTIALDDDWW